MTQPLKVPYEELPKHVRDMVAGQIVAPPMVRPSFNKRQVRSFAIRCLGPLDRLDQKQRRRVLEHALKMNSL